MLESKREGVHGGTARGAFGKALGGVHLIWEGSSLGCIGFRAVYGSRFRILGWSAWLEGLESGVYGGPNGLLRPKTSRNLSSPKP